MKSLLFLAITSSMFLSTSKQETTLGSFNKLKVIKESSLIVDNKFSLLGNKLTVDLPEEFELMSAEMLAVKYPSGNRPTVVYTNEDGTINFAFNHTQNPLPVDKLAQVLPAFVSQFGTLYPEIQWYKKEMQSINGTEYIVLEFVTPAVDSKIYNIMHVTSLNGKLLFCTFNCLESQKSEWEAKAKVSLNSVVLKE